MADTITFKLEGLDELLGKFREVTYDVKRRGGRSSLRKAAMVVVNAAKQKARGLDDPETDKSIPDSITLRWNGRLFKSTEDLGFRVGVLGGAQPRPGNVGYWRFLEFGTSKIPARPFMRPALEQNIQLATTTFINEYKKALDRAIKRANKARA